MVNAGKIWYRIKWEFPNMQVPEFVSENTLVKVSGVFMDLFFYMTFGS